MEMIKKQTLIESINNLPDEIEVDEVIERIILLSKVQRAKDQIDKGLVFSLDDVKKERLQWQNK